MSALLPKADMDWVRWNVRFVPKADIGARQISVRFTPKSGRAADRRSKICPNEL